MGCTQKALMKELISPTQTVEFSRQFPNMLKSVKLVETVVDDAGGEYEGITNEGTSFILDDKLVSGMKHCIFSRYLDLRDRGIAPLANVRIEENVVRYERVGTT